MHASGTNRAAFRTVEFFSSHEALLLDYERAMPRIDPRPDCPHTSTHWPWIGERTRPPDGAHVEFSRVVRNPVGGKLGPSTTPEDAVGARGAARPGREPGRLTLVARMGAAGSGPAWLRSWRRSRRAACRGPGSATPCTATRSRRRTGARPGTWRTSSPRSAGSSRYTARSAPIPAATHIEFTGDDVTECVGGSHGLTEDDLTARYETACDPDSTGASPSTWPSA